MKKVLVIILAVVLATSFASCSPQSPTEEVQIEATPVASEKEPVKLVFNSLAWIKAEQDVQKALIDQWNAQNPDIQVQLVSKDWNTHAQELLTGFETGDVPDIFHFAQPVIADWKNLGYLDDMSVMLTEEDIADVNPDVWAGLTSDTGAIVGIPIQYEVDVTFYNTKIFEKNNITPPTMDNPWTFDEMVEVARQLQGTEGSDFMGMGFPGLERFGRYFTEVWAPKIGDPLVYTNDAGEYYVKLNDESIELISKIKGLIDEGLISPEMMAVGSDQLAMTQFLNQKAAMIVGYGCWYRAQLLNKTEGVEAFEWGVAAPIKVNDTKVYGYIQTLSVPAASKHKEEAYKFLKWYWSTENTLAVAKAAFIMPGKNSAILDESLNTPEYSWDLVQQAVQHNVLPHYVTLPGWGQFNESVATTLFGDYWAGSISLEELVSRFESEGTRILQEANK